MQNHIYELGLLHGQCSDIRIRAFGKMYHFHRLLLIQSGFFRAMLCGGYAEDLAVSSAASRGSKRETDIDPLFNRQSRYPLDADIVELRFDDPNISRAAFEYCVARLYGAGPKLVLPTWSSPYDTDSLTPSALASSDVLNAPLCDSKAHPATPRFLLSLLATSIYLNIPSITSQALTLVLCSVTPFTVTHYLQFAIGRGIAGTDLYRSAGDVDSQPFTEWDWELDGPVRTLEQLARPCSQPTSGSAQPLSRASSSTSTSTSQHANCKSSTFDGIDRSSRSIPNTESSEDELSAPLKRLSGHTAAETAKRRSELLYDASEANFGSDLDSSLGRSTGKQTSQDERKTAGLSESLRLLALEEAVHELPEYHYGAAADKIGEACVCWYAQKGYDNFFTMEIALEADRIREIESWIRLAREERNLERLLLLRDLLHSGDIDLLQSSRLTRGSMPRPNEGLPRPQIKVWAYPSLPSTWVRSIISSDSFFVRTEWERYDFAKRIIEFRRKQKRLIQALDTLIERYLHELARELPEDSLDATSDQNFYGDAAQEGTFCRKDATQGEDRHFAFRSFRRRSDASMNSQESIAQRSDDWKEETGSSHGIDDEDEAEYEELFTSGIYYSHMSFQELNRISRDISPATGRPYAPLHVLQAALWVSNELRNHVMSSVRPDAHATNIDAGWDHEADDTHRNPPTSPEVNQEAEGHGELGVSSALSDFQRAFETHSAAVTSANRHTRSRDDTPFSGAEALPTLERQPSLGLGGIAENSLLFGGPGGKAGLLKKRYYLVTSDDTIRFGDGLMSVIGINTSTSQPLSAPRRMHDESQGLYDDKVVDDLGPTGYAAAQIPHTVPIETLTNRDCGPSDSHKKTRDHYYGIANDVATGRELGESAYRASKVDIHNQQHSSPLASRSPQYSTRELKPGDPAESGEVGSASSTPETAERWSAFEPMRIGVEFFGIDKLSEKQRLYSPTFFYAGSVWNLYIQLVRKTKGVQLGIYLHRQSPNETLPPPSAPTANDVNALPSSPQSVTSHNHRRRADFMSPATPRRAARTEQASTPDVRSGGDNAAQRLRAGVQRSQDSTQGFENNDSESGATSSFFDTSLTVESPLRPTGRQTQVGPTNGGRIGSSVSLPGGQTMTSLLGTTSTALFSDDHDATAAAAPYSSSSDDAIQTVPATSSAPLFPGLASNFLRSGPPLSGSMSIPSLRSDPHSQPTVPLFPGGPSVLQTCPPPAMPYKDPRVELRAYFSIHCPSPLGNALTKFSSGPDKFTNSQSWGWKSSSLLGAVYLENGDLEKGGQSGFWPRFRCVCTIGLV